MFTGIVEEVGTVRHVAQTAAGMRLEIASTRVVEDLSVDSSVNVAGACLTVVERDDHGFAVDVVAETLARTTLGGAIRGTRVNLERAATPTTALGGHFVQGHVDGTTKLLSRREEGGGAARLRFTLPKAFARYVVAKGFITIDGVSLTIATLGRASFDVALIPHTAERTTLGALREKELVNFETDVLAKYVRRLLGRTDRN
jgi:riboflavin synthase